MNGSTNSTIRPQQQINNGQPQRNQNIHVVRPLPIPQNNANRINNTFIDQQYNDLINGDPFNRIQCSPQQDTP
ncbi:34401_t:CDS:1, partial [Gigaspora margarita]